jgi:hypothetical protein
MAYPLLSAAFLFVLLMYPVYIIEYGWTDKGYVPTGYKWSFSTDIPMKVALIASYLSIYAVRAWLMALGFDVDWLAIAVVQGMLAMAYLYWI